MGNNTFVLEALFILLDRWIRQ